MNQISIIIGGILTLFMSIFHLRSYQFFGWAKEFEKISLRNQKIIYTIHLSLLLLFLGMGLLSLAFFRQLAGSYGLALGINIILSLFWLWRGIWQMVYFQSVRVNKMRKYVWFGKTLTIVFFILFVSYFLPVVLHIAFNSSLPIM